MLQQVMTEPGKIIFREIPVPEIGDGQVLVKIMDIGVCGSDIHVYHGKHPFTKYPVTQGHEVSGEIVKCGANVEELTVGQKVTIEPQVYCGKCYPCRHGKYNLCEELKGMGTTIVAAVVLLWYGWPGFRRALHGMTFFGRMSLTNYLLQSLLGTALFYNWGLGLYRHVDVIYGTLAGVGIILVQYLFCRLWLRRHTHGPVEWVWKKLTWIDLPLFDRKIAS